MIWILKLVALLLIGWIVFAGRPRTRRQSARADAQKPEHRSLKAPRPADGRGTVSPPKPPPRPLEHLQPWYELMRQHREEGLPQLVLANPDWNSKEKFGGEARHDLERFIAGCGESGFQVTLDIRPGYAGLVWTDYAPHLAFLSRLGIAAKPVNGDSLVHLFYNCEPFSLIIVAIREDGSQAMDHAWQEKLYSCGIRDLTREHAGYSYVNVILKKTPLLYTCLLESLSAEPLHYSFKATEALSNFRLPVGLDIVSEGAACGGGTASIRIDGMEHAENKRGMNIVVFQLLDHRVVLSEAVDTSSTVFRNRTVYMGHAAEITL